MSTLRFFVRFGVILILLGVILGGCATPKVAIKLDPAFYSMGVKKIAVLPIVDRRKDKSYVMDFHADIRIPAANLLQEKGYAAMMAKNFAEGRTVDTAEVAVMDSSQLAKLGPAEVDAIVLIYIEDVLSSYKVMSYAFKIEATACMISKKTGLEVWRDKQIGSSGQGGLISGLTQGLDRSSAISSCVSGLFASLPAFGEKPKSESE
jgi:hypothetical protein